MELLHRFSCCSSDGPVNVTISGPSSLEVGVTATFTCSATCVPTCAYTWSVFGSPVHGRSIDLTLNRYVATESISCEARNDASGNTAAVNDTLRVSGPRSLSSISSTTSRVTQLNGVVIILHLVSPQIPIGADVERGDGAPTGWDCVRPREWMAAYLNCNSTVVISIRSDLFLLPRYGPAYLPMHYTPLSSVNNLGVYVRGCLYLAHRSSLLSIDTSDTIVCSIVFGPLR